MRVIKLDKSEGLLKVEPQSLEDLWYLTKLIEEGDEATGRSYRTWKPPGVERAVAEKKPVKIKLKLENIDFAQAANKLRLTGKIVAGEPEEYCPRGEHHTLDINIGDVLQLHKEINSYHQAILDEAKKRSKHLRVVVLVIDEEKALLSELETKGIAFGAEFRNHANKRDPKTFEEKQSKYFEEVALALDAKAKGGARVLVAGPGFAHKNLQKLLQNKFQELAKRTTYEHANSAEKTAVFELLKTGALGKLMHEQKLKDEFEALEKFKGSIGRSDGLAVYGEKVGEMVENGACSELFVLDEVLRKDKKVQKILENAKSLGAKIVIFNSEDDAGAEFKTFKIAAMLRYRV